VNRCRRALPRAALWLAALACNGTPDASFELDTPSAVADQAAWYEIGVFPGGCPSKALLLGGIPEAGTIARLAFAATSTAPPLGDLPKQSYGIAAVALAADCSVIAVGCAATSVSGAGSISVSLAAVSGTPEGSCASGSVCNEATCVPSGDAGTPLGSGCSLELVGQGPLADPLGQDMTLLSAPAISATPKGFLLAYREFDPTMGSARLTTFAIDPTGAAAAPVQTSLPGTCTDSPPTDATALVFTGSQGTLALSRPACPGNQGGVDMLGVDPTGAILQSSFSGQGGLDVTLGQAHALASSPGGVLLAYTNPSMQTSFAATVNGVTIEANPVPLAYSGWSGFVATNAAYVVATSYGSAFVGLGTPGPDAGTMGGLELNVAAAPEMGDAGVIAAPSFPAQWGAASATGTRVLVASNGPSAASSILWSAFDMGSTMAGPSGTFAPASMGNVAYVDVALDGDHAFFAAQVDDTISLFAFEKASTFPVFLEEVPFSTLSALPLGSLSGGLVAVAASDAQVAVVWESAPMIGSDQNVGGYAVFACNAQ
jgi:hypothetical protein